MKWFISVSIFTLAVISSVSSITWEDCGSSSDPVKLTEFSVTRKGYIFYVSMKSRVGENLTEPISATLDVRKRFFDVFIPIPCMNNIGSCHYDDICELSPWINDPCPEDFVKNNLPCRCPVLKNNYEAKHFPVDLSKFPENEIKGTYKITLLLNKNGAELFCFKMKIKI